MGNNTPFYNRKYYLENRERLKAKRDANKKETVRIKKPAPDRTEYQKEYRKKNKERLREYNTNYVRAKRWLNGSDNYSGQIG